MGEADGLAETGSSGRVTWKDEAYSRTFKSAAEVQEAVNTGELTIEEPGVVVNMPMLTWPIGQR